MDLHRELFDFCIKILDSYEILYTFTDGVSNLYADTIELTGFWISAGSSSASSQSVSPSPYFCLALEFDSNGCVGPFSTEIFTIFPVSNKLHMNSEEIVCHKRWQEWTLVWKDKGS